MIKISAMAASMSLFMLFTTASQAQEPPPWNVPECEFVKENIKLAPENLVSAFLASDIKGYFLDYSPGWIYKAILCPAGLPSPDMYTVINGFKIENSLVKEDSAKVTVTYDVIGEMTSGGYSGELIAFIPGHKLKSETFELVKTPFGWRLKEFPINMVLGVYALEFETNSGREWKPGDDKNFLRAMGFKAQE